jgi:hypothetical protein
MNGETKLHESIIAMLTMLGAEDPLPAARVLESAVKEAIEEGIEKLKAELIARTYPAIVAEPPAQPAFAVGTRVRVKSGGYEGSVLDTGENDSVFVKMDTIIHPFWRDASELELVFPVGQRVKTKHSSEIGIVTERYDPDTDHLRAQFPSEDEPTSWRQYELEAVEPLSEPAPALPKGVTRVQRDTPRGAAFVVERQGVDAVNLVHFDGSKTIDVKCGADRILFDLDDFENFIAAGQALIAEKRANNGR